MIDQTRSYAVQIQSQSGIGKVLHVGNYRSVLLIPDHPGIGKENIGFIVAVQSCSQNIVIIVQFYIVEFYIRIGLIEPVKFHFQRFEVVVASGNSDAAVCVCIKQRFKFT